MFQGLATQIVKTDTVLIMHKLQDTNIFQSAILNYVTSKNVVEMLTN